MEDGFDCVVVGGGGAGLSAALVLGRARRRTLVIDAGEQSNLPAAGVGGLFGNDRRPPAELYATGRAEIARHPSVEIRGGVSALEARAATDGFEIELDDGSRARPQAAAGARDGVPRAAAARPAGALGRRGLPLPLLSRLGGPRGSAGGARRGRGGSGAGGAAAGLGATT